MRAPVLGIYRFPKFVLINFDFKNLEAKRGHQNSRERVRSHSLDGPALSLPGEDFPAVLVQSFSTKEKPR